MLNVRTRVKAAMVKESVLNTITKLRTRLQAVGDADPKVVKWLCKAFNSDAVMVGDVTQWNQIEANDSKLSTAGLNVKLIAKDGKVIWHATHADTYKESYGWLSALGDAVKGGADDTALDKALEMTAEKIVKKLPGASK